MRQVNLGFMPFLRGDLVYGARRTWGEQPPANMSCSCGGMLENAGYYWFSLWNTDDVCNNEPETMVCGRNTASVQYHGALSYPLPRAGVDGLIRMIKNRNKPDGREVFIFGHGGWNGFESSKTMRWVEQFDEAMAAAMPNFFVDGIIGTPKFSRLFMMPHAQGPNKFEQYVGGQNNLVLQKHARAVKPFLEKRGYNVLGTFNLTIQASSYDGTHSSFENTLVKTMMALNWLDKLST